MSQRRTLRLYAVFQFFFSLLLWLPVYYEYQKRVGMTDAEIFAIQSIYQIFFCLLEIPTGMVADVWGRRRCMRIGAGMLLLANLMAIFSANYLGFFIHFMLVAVSRSFISGAASAYLYDYMKSQGMQDQYKDVEGRTRAYSLVGRVFGWAGIGAAMAWHLTLPYWLTALSAAIAFGAASRLPMIAEDQQLKGTSPLGGVIENLRAVFKMLSHSPMLLFVMFQGVALFVLSRVQIDLYQPILRAKDFSLASFGWIMSGITIFEAIGTARPGWIQKRTGSLNAIFLITAALGVLIMLIPAANQAWTVVVFAAYSFAVGIAFPIQKQLLNDQITDSRYRATVLSVESIVDRGFTAANAYVMGLYMTSQRLDTFLVHAGLFTFCVIFVLLGAVQIQARRVAKLA
jgi:MFS family permease